LVIMFTSKNKSVDLTHFESKSSGIDSGDEINISENSSNSGEISDGNRSIAIIGSGDFGRALALRMVQSGLTVNIGSRNPQRNRELVAKTGAKLLSTEEALATSTSNIVILAVPKDFYERQPLKALEGKVVVDVSNRSSIYAKDPTSQAEYLQSLLPRSAVVKAFNVLSAYALESGGLQGSKEVFYAGDVHSAKEEVNGLIRFLGFTPIDRGALRNAREIEDIPVQRFPLWKAPLIVSIVFFIILFLLAFTKMQICWTLTWDGYWHWGRWSTIPITTINSTLAAHSITLLALCYLPGCMAAWIQMIRGTKYSRFPNWLDKWLKMRKQLGLLMLFSASLHMCMSVAIMSPTQYSLAYGDPGQPGGDAIKIIADVKKPKGWTDFTIEYNQTVSVYGSEKMNLRGECFLLAGVMAYALAILLGITSLPSVTNVLTWKEFGFVQSKLGWLCLLFACAHDISYGWPYMWSPSCKVPPTFQYALYIPALTIGMKIPVVILDKYLTKIRSGWERNSKSRFGNAKVQPV